MIRLPQINRSNQVAAMIVGYLIFVALYLGSASLSLRPPTLLEPTPLDAALPFLDRSIWIYLSQFVLLPVAIACARDDEGRSRTFYALLIATLLAACLFVAIPTQLPRPEIGGNGLTAQAWRLLLWADVPTNCFPSLHVALAIIAGGALWRRGWRTLSVIWPAAIILSTLTTRQHIVWDALGGLALALIARAFSQRIVPHDPAQASDRLARG